MKTKKPVKVITKVKSFDRKKLVIGAVILGILGLLFIFKNQFVVAFVGGRPIWRLTYSQELNKLAGKQTLDSLITRSLIAGEAKKQNIVIPNTEIQVEITKIEDFAKQQGTDLNQLLIQQGMSRQNLMNDIQLNKMVEKMAGTESAKVQEWIINLQTQAKIIKWVK